MHARIGTPQPPHGRHPLSGPGSTGARGTHVPAMWVMSSRWPSYVRYSEITLLSSSRSSHTNTWAGGAVGWSVWLVGWSVGWWPASPAAVGAWAPGEAVAGRGGQVGTGMGLGGWRCVGVVMRGRGGGGSNHVIDVVQVLPHKRLWIGCTVVG
jgi:hypothetical protein